MKTYTNKLRYWAVLSSLSLMATAYPAFSQNDSSSQSGSQQSQGTSLNEPSTSQRSQAAPADSSLSRMNRADNTGVPIDEPSGADNSASNWSWVGLFGLKRRHEAHDETYRPARAT